VHQKKIEKLNVDRFTLSAAKCRPMILVYRSIKYMRKLVGVLRAGGVKLQWVVEDGNFHRFN